MEAGAGTLTRMPPGSLDVAVLVVEPSAKSIDVARRAAAIIAERTIGQLLVVANRVRAEEDLELIRAGLPGIETVGIPDDPAIVQADREAHAPFETGPDGPGVQALAALALRLERWSRQPAPDETLPVLS